MSQAVRWFHINKNCNALASNGVKNQSVKTYYSHTISFLFYVVMHA